MALSPPKASRAGLCARQATQSDTTASILIHAIVTACTRWILQRNHSFHYGTVVACFAVEDPCTVAVPPLLS
jgi:hypothetical protein